MKKIRIPTVTTNQDNLLPMGHQPESRQCHYDLNLHCMDTIIDTASKKMSISKNEWLLHGNISKLLKQKTLSDYF